MVVMPAEVVLHHRDRRWSKRYSCPAFDRAKSAAHIAVALYALSADESNLGRRGGGIVRLAGHVDAALTNFQHSHETELVRETVALLERCQRFAHVAGEQISLEELRAKFASEAGPQILRITELATREQISGLHEAVEAALSRLSTADQAALQVVVLGDHQARARSLGMQYFKRRFQEKPGTDQRVTFGENITDEAEAILLVGTRRLDKQIAQAFFGDENRLQRDVLGDAAARCLDEMGFPESAPDSIPGTE